MYKRQWYSGTPEPDRFRDNGAGQVLKVSLGAAGRPPEVVALAVGRHRWLSERFELRVPSDIERLGRWLGEPGPEAVLDVTLEGEVDLVGHQAVLRLLDETEARVRVLRRDLQGLRLLPSDEDIEALRADGYLGEVVEELRATVRAAAGRPDEAAAAGSSGALAVSRQPAETAQAALAILTGILARRGSVPEASR